MHLLAVLFPAGLSSVLLRQRPDKYTDDVAVIFFVICAMFAMVLTSMRASAMPLLAAWSSVAAAMVLGEFVVVHVHIMLASSTVMSSIDIMDESKQEANSSNNSNNNEPTAKNQGTSNRKKSTQKNEQRKRRGALEEREAHSGHLYLSTSLLLGLGFALTFFWWLESSCIDIVFCVILLLTSYSFVSSDGSTVCTTNGSLLDSNSGAASIDNGAMGAIGTKGTIGVMAAMGVGGFWGCGVAGAAGAAGVAGVLAGTVGVVDI